MTQRNKDADPSSWVLTQTDLMKVLFHKYAQSGFLEGNRAAELLSASRLAFLTLARIWDMADKDGDGRLDETEFVLAFHLCVCISKRNLPLPEQLPDLLEKWYADQKARKLPRYAKGNKVIHTRSSDGLQRRGTVVGVHADDIVRGFYYTVRLEGDDQQELQANEERLSHDEPGRTLARVNSSIPYSENSFVVPSVPNSDDDFGDFEGGEPSGGVSRGALGGTAMEFSSSMNVPTQVFPPMSSPPSFTHETSFGDFEEAPRAPAAAPDAFSSFAMPIPQSMSDPFGMSFKGVAVVNDDDFGGFESASIAPIAPSSTTSAPIFMSTALPQMTSMRPTSTGAAPEEISFSSQSNAVQDDDGDEFVGEFVSAARLEPPLPTLKETSSTDQDDGDVFVQSPAPLESPLQQTTPCDPTAQDDGDAFVQSPAPLEPPVQPKLNETIAQDDDGNVVEGEFVPSAVQDDRDMFVRSEAPMEPPVQFNVNETSPFDPPAQDDSDVNETSPTDPTTQDDGDVFGFGGEFVSAAPSEPAVQPTMTETSPTDPTAQDDGDVFGFGGEFVSAAPSEPAVQPTLKEACDPAAQDDDDVFGGEFVQSDPAFHTSNVSIDQIIEPSNDLSASNSNTAGEEAIAKGGMTPLEAVHEDKRDAHGDSLQEEEDVIIANNNNNREASPVFNSGSEEEFVSVPPATTTASSSSPEQILYEEATMEEPPATESEAVSPFDIHMGDSGGGAIEEEDDDMFGDFAHVVESVPLQVTDSGLLFRESSQASTAEIKSDPFGDESPQEDLYEFEIPPKDTNFAMDSIPKVFQKVDDDDDFGGEDDFVVAAPAGMKESPSDPAAVNDDDSFQVQALPTFAGIDHPSQSLTASSIQQQQQQQQTAFTLIDDLDFGDFSAPPPSSSSLQRANTAPMETPKAATGLQRTSTAPTVGRSGGFSLRKAPAAKNDSDDDFDFSTAISTSQERADWMSATTGEGGRVPFASRTPAKPPKVNDDEDDDGGIVFDMSTPQKDQ